MKEFVRSENYMTKIFLESFDRDVRMDKSIDIIWSSQHNKLKAYCPDTGTYLQFPTRLRFRGAKYIADIIKATKEGGTPFFRAFRGSIRNAETGEVVA